MSKRSLDRPAVLLKLESSARENDGKPNFSQVKTDTGVSRPTLRKWWKQFRTTEVSTLSTSLSTQLSTSPRMPTGTASQGGAPGGPHERTAGFLDELEQGLASAEDTTTGAARAGDLLSLPGDQHRVAILGELIEERDGCKSATARARLSIEIAKLSLELRPPDVEEDLADLPLEERLERLQMAVAVWPDDYLEVALRIYGERHKGRILLVTDQGRARLEEEGWEPVTVSS